MRRRRKKPSSMEPIRVLRKSTWTTPSLEMVPIF